MTLTRWNGFFNITGDNADWGLRFFRKEVRLG